MTSKPQFAGERVRLGDIANVTTGNVAPKASDFSEEGIPFVRAGSLSGLIKNGDYDTLDKVDEPTAKQLKLKLFPAGTVLFAKSGMSCLKGYVYTLKRPCYVVSHLACVTPKGSTSTFLQYYFKYNRPNRLIENPSFPSIKLSKISEIEIAIPDERTLSAQTAVLDKINEQTAITQEQISRLDILVKSRFVDMFGDQKTNNLGLPTSKLGNVAFVGSSKRVFKDELKDSGVPFFRGTEVGALAFSERIKPELFITREHYDELVAHTGKPEVGDLLMPSICPGGQIWLVDTTKPFYFKDGRVLWVRPDHEILDSTFLQYALRNRFVSDFDSFASGTTFAELKIFVLKDLDVTLPSLSLQREFADFASRVDKLRVVAEEQKKKLQTLYDSLAQEYFAI